MEYFGLKLGQDLGNRAAHPYQEFRGVTPPPPPPGPAYNQNWKLFNCSRRFVVYLTGSAAICNEIVLSYKIAEKPNEKANAHDQSSQLAGEEE